MIRAGMRHLGDGGGGRTGLARGGGQVVGSGHPGWRSRRYGATRDLTAGRWAEQIQWALPPAFAGGLLAVWGWGG